MITTARHTVRLHTLTGFVRKLPLRAVLALKTDGRLTLALIIVESTDVAIGHLRVAAISCTKEDGKVT